MAYANTPSRKKGIYKQSDHFPKLKKLFEEGIFRMASSQEDQKQKFDYCLELNNYPYYFDLKTADNPDKGFCLTHINNINENVFEVGCKDICFIFLLEHKNSYAFVKKNDVYDWFKQTNAITRYSKNDRSTYFVFPTDIVEKLAQKIKHYD